LRSANRPPLRQLANLVLAPVGARQAIERDARRFLGRLLEVNSTGVQSDILNRVQESRNRLEAEIRKLLQQIQRTSVEALTAVSAELARLEREVRAVQASATYPMQEDK
jgi:hypothetical protein